MTGLGGARLARVAALLAAAALAISCNEKKNIEEHLRLLLLPTGHVVAAVDIDLPVADPATPLGARVEEGRLAALQGTDPWSLRFARCRPLEERYEWRKKAGTLRSVRRAALVERVDDLNRLLSDTAIHVREAWGPGWREIAIDTSPPANATADERKAMEEVLGLFAERVSAYIAATVAIYRYLDDHPDRTDLLFRGMVESVEDEDEVSAEETRLLEAWGKAVEGASQMLDVPWRSGDDPYTPEELSRRVYDPFPGDVTVHVPGPVLESEGFLRDEPGRWRAPRTHLGSAWLAVADRWVSPDPLLMFVKAREAGQEDGWDVDAGTLALLPRRFGEPPTARDVRDALLAGLRPPAVLRLRFQAARPAPDAAPPEDWWELPAEEPEPVVTAELRRPS